MTITREPHWLTGAEAAESLSIAARTFRGWRVEPVAVVSGVRYYTAEAVISNRLNQERQRTTCKETPLSELKAEADALDAELTRLRAGRIDLRSAELRGEMVALDEITRRIGNTASASASALSTLPGKIRRFIPSLTHSEVDRIRVTIARHQNRIPEEWKRINVHKE